MMKIIPFILCLMVAYSCDTLKSNEIMSEGGEVEKAEVTINENKIDTFFSINNEIKYIQSNNNVLKEVLYKSIDDCTERLNLRTRNGSTLIDSIILYEEGSCGISYLIKSYILYDSIITRIVYPDLGFLYLDIIDQKGIEYERIIENYWVKGDGEILLNNKTIDTLTITDENNF